MIVGGREDRPYGQDAEANGDALANVLAMAVALVAVAVARAMRIARGVVLARVAAVIVLALAFAGVGGGCERAEVCGEQARDHGGRSGEFLERHIGFPFVLTPGGGTVPARWDQG